MTETKAGRLAKKKRFNNRAVVAAAVFSAVAVFMLVWLVNSVSDRGDEGITLTRKEKNLVEEYRSHMMSEDNPINKPVPPEVAEDPDGGAAGEWQKANYEASVKYQKETIEALSKKYGLSSGEIKVVLDKATEREAR